MNARGHHHNRRSVNRLHPASSLTSIFRRPPDSSSSASRPDLRLNTIRISPDETQKRPERSPRPRCGGESHWRFLKSAAASALGYLRHHPTRARKPRLNESASERIRPRTKTLGALYYCRATKEAHHGKSDSMQGRRNRLRLRGSCRDGPGSLAEVRRACKDRSQHAGNSC